MCSRSGSVVVIVVVVTLVETRPLAAAFAIRRGGGRHGRRRRRRFFGRRRRALLLVVADGAWPPRGRVAGIFGGRGRCFVAVPRRREGAATEGLVEEHFVSRARGQFGRGLSYWSLAERLALEGLVFHGRGAVSDAAWAGARQHVRRRFELVLCVRMGLGGVCRCSKSWSELACLLVSCDASLILFYLSIGISQGSEELPMQVF